MPDPANLALSLARALRAEMDQPGRSPADDPQSLLTALAIVIAAQVPPCCECRRHPREA
jgi:hypothetical protein